MAQLQQRSDVGKSLEQFAISQSEQLELFAPEELADKYSSVLEFYDAVPKFVMNRKPIKAVSDIPIIEQPFEFGKRDYSVSIVPAIIKGSDGKPKICFAGEREEIVEDGLVAGMPTFLLGGKIHTQLDLSDAA